MAQFWIKQCIEQHKKCPKPMTNGFMPTRVIDVGNDENSEPRLCETKSLTVPQLKRRFVALSHCWGTTKTLTTTTATLSERQRGITLDELPLVFRHAVITTRKLGIRYIWIDSLCIIQDSESDWEAESVKMCQIYQSAIVTIASAHSSNSQGGLFVNRDGYRIVPFEIIVNLPVELAREERRFQFIPTPRREISWDVNDLPLYKRAWTFQELVLAPRTLIFDPDALRWECLTMHGSERSPDGGIARHHTAIKILQGAVMSTVVDGIDSFDKLGPDMAMQSNIWEHVIEDYTARNLTKQSDRLIAVAGIAESIQRNSKNVYVAGLWKLHLAFQLLWFVRTMFSRASPGVMDRRHLPNRPIDQIAPSWSWASCEAPATYHPTNPHLLSRAMCEVREVTVTGSQHRQSGKLVIYGDTRVLRVFSGDNSVISEVERLQGSPKYQYKGQYDLVKSLVGPDDVILVSSSTSRWKYHVEAVPGLWQPDENIKTSVPITFLAIARSDRHAARSIELRRPLVYTIALISTENTGEYRRVGYAEWEDCTWFGYDCSEDLVYKQPAWERLGKSWSRIKPPKLGDTRDHKHPIEHDPLPDLSLYNDEVSVKRCELTIV
jgi:heterokaryon incompatibility protein (HET)